MNKKIFKKIIIFLIIIGILVLIIHITRNFIIVKGLQESLKEYISSSNYHIKMEQTIKGTKVMTKYYKKDEKQLVILERIKEDKTTRSLMYNNGNRIDSFWETENEKTVQIGTQNFITVSLDNRLETANNWQTLLACMFARIKSVECKGKQCYRITNYNSPLFLAGVDVNEAYIEKDTGLLVKTIIDEEISEREYEFDNVSDELFTEPDISQYKLQ